MAPSSLVMIAMAPFLGRALAAASCLAISSKAGGQDRAAASRADAGQMAGTISSPGFLGSSGSLGQSPGSSSGTAS